MKSKIIVLLFTIFFTSSANAEGTDKLLPTSRSEITLSFSPLVKKVAPAVVNIYSKRKIKYRNTSPFFNDPLFKHFFGDTFGNGITEKEESSLGSGVIVKANGLIVTSNHVIKGSDKIKVVLSDRREFSAKVILTDEKTDLAMLKIEAKDEQLPFLPLANSDKLEVGDLVLAIGNPFGVGQTVTNGIISALARTAIGVSDYQFFIQTDAAINPGNSGGALVNMEGKLAGINTAIYTESGGSNGIGFAIPANMVATIIDGSNVGKQIVRPWVGITATTVTQEIATSLGLPAPQGALIKEIYPDSPVDQAEIKVGDVVTSIDDFKIIDEKELHFRVATYKIGSNANFRIFRSGKELSFNVEMAEPIESPKKDLRLIRGNTPLTGVTVANLSPAVANILDLDLNDMSNKVVVMEVADNSPAMRVGFKKKDIIVDINEVAVESTKQLEELVTAKTSSLKLAILRGNRTINIILTGKQ